MPATYTYPGVYVEEIPSGVRTVTGVSTADTAFVDVFARGPVNKPVRLTSFGDFVRIFGGLDPRSESSYAIQQYYLNGGQTAWVVRVTAGTADQARRALPDGAGTPKTTLTVRAANPGVWGNNLQVAVVNAGTNLFNLVVREVATVNGRVQVLASETYRNLNMSTTNPRYAPAVVNAGSALVVLEDAGTGAMPAGVASTASGGAPEDAFAALEKGTDGSTLDGMSLIGTPAAPKTGLYALDGLDPFVFNLLCLPAVAELATGGNAVIAAAQAYCETKRAFLILDIPRAVQTPAQMVDWMAANDGVRNRNTAIYFPRVEIPDPVNENRPRNVGASGTLAGVFARTDATRGVWKAPAGTEADLRNARPVYKLSDGETGGLNPLGINTLRTFPVYGNVAWGARTLDGADQRASEWKYIPVRRLALYLEESLYQGLKWVVFEPNDEPLWAQIRLNAGAFMHGLFRQGAFAGSTPRDAYFVKCDRETTTQADINLGIVNVVVGFAPLKPAEFVVLKIQQMAGQLAV